MKEDNFIYSIPCDSNEKTDENLDLLMEKEKKNLFLEEVDSFKIKREIMNIGPRITEKK